MKLKSKVQNLKQSVSDFAAEKESLV